MTNRLNKLIAAGFSLTLMAPAFGDTITLDMVVRDFKVSHPDFESFLGYQAGMVESTLGVDGTPVYVPGASKITSAATFYDWYHNVPGTNITSIKQISLDNGLGATTGGIYTYDNQSFFPIDGEGWGNEGYSHNYHFTVQIATMFTYQAGQNFSFRGDDDVWVFINKQLVVDLDWACEDAESEHKAFTGIVRQIITRELTA